jgi:hypothetical protein
MRNFLISTATFIAAASHWSDTHSASVDEQAAAPAAIQAPDTQQSHGTGQQDVGGLVIKWEDVVKEPGRVLLCMNRDHVALTPVYGKSGWAVPVKLTVEIVAALKEHDGRAVAELVIKPGAGDQAVETNLRRQVEDAASKIGDQDLEMALNVGVAANGSFIADCAELGLDHTKYEKSKEKSDQATVKEDSFRAIPLIFSGNECRFEFTPEVAKILVKNIEIGRRVEAIRANIRKLIEAKKAEIGDMQATLDQIAELEEKNAELARQIAEAKEKTAKPVADAKAKLDAANAKLRAAEAMSQTSSRRKQLRDEAIKVATAEVDSAKEELAIAEEPVTTLFKVEEGNTEQINALLNDQKVSDARSAEKKHNEKIDAEMAALRDAYEK